MSEQIEKGEGSFMRRVHGLKGKRNRAPVNYCYPDSEEEEDFEAKKRKFEPVEKEKKEIEEKERKEEAEMKKKKEAEELEKKKKKDAEDCQEDEKKEAEEAENKKIVKKKKKKSKMQVIVEDGKRKVDRERKRREREETARENGKSEDSLFEKLKKEKEKELRKEKDKSKFEELEMDKELAKQKEKLKSLDVQMQSLERMISLKEKKNMGMKQRIQNIDDMIEEERKSCEKKILGKKKELEKMKLNQMIVQSVIDQKKKSLGELKQVSIARMFNIPISEKNGVKELRKSHTHNERVLVGRYATKNGSSYKSALTHFGETLGIVFTQQQYSKWKNVEEIYHPDLAKDNDIRRVRTKDDIEETIEIVLSQLDIWCVSQRKLGKLVSLSMATDQYMILRRKNGLSVPEVRNSQTQTTRRAIDKLQWEKKTSGNRGFLHLQPRDLLLKVLELKKSIEKVRNTKGFVFIVNPDETAVAEIKGPNKTFVSDSKDNGNFAKNSTGKMTHTSTLMGFLLLFNGKIVGFGKGDMNVIFHCGKNTKLAIPRFFTKLKLKRLSSLKGISVFQNSTGKTTAKIYENYIVEFFERSPNLIIEVLQRLGWEKKLEDIKNDVSFILYDDSAGQHLKAHSEIQKRLCDQGFVYSRIPCMTGLTDYCQPMDLGVNAAFKELVNTSGIKEIYAGDSPIALTHAGNLKKPSKEDILFRIIDSFRNVADANVKKSFILAGFGSNIEDAKWWDIFSHAESSMKSQDEVEFINFMKNQERRDEEERRKDDNYVNSKEVIIHDEDIFEEDEYGDDDIEVIEDGGKVVDSQTNEEDNSQTNEEDNDIVFHD